MFTSNYKDLIKNACILQKLAFHIIFLEVSDNNTWLSKIQIPKCLLIFVISSIFKLSKYINQNLYADL